MIYIDCSAKLKDLKVVHTKAAFLLYLCDFLKTIHSNLHNVNLLRGSIIQILAKLAKSV